MLNISAETTVNWDASTAFSLSPKDITIFQVKRIKGFKSSRDDRNKKEQWRNRTG